MPEFVEFLFWGLILIVIGLRSVTRSQKQRQLPDGSDPARSADEVQERLQRARDAAARKAAARDAVALIGKVDVHDGLLSFRVKILAGPGFTTVGRF